MPVNVEIKTRRGTAAEWASANPVLSDGEPGLETDTGVIKYGDDVSHWDELPAANKQFQNVVTVAKSGKRGTADFICSDTIYGGSDAACIQAAINSANTYDYIKILKGDYTLTSPLTSTGKSLYLDATGAVFNINVGVNPAFSFSGEYITTYPLASNALSESTEIVLTSVNNIQVGNTITIYNNVQWCPNDYPSLMTGETYLITAINNNTLTIDRGLVRDYNTSDASYVLVYRAPVIIIDGGSYINTGSANDVKGILIKRCKNSIIKNCILDKNGRAAISIDRSYNITITNNSISNSKLDGLGYGITIYDACANITILNNYIRDCRHCIMSGNTQYLGVNRDITIENNKLYGTSAGATIDAHPSTINYIVRNNEIHNTRRTAAFLDGTKFSEFYNNVIYNGYAYVKRGYIDNTEKYVYNNIIFDGSLIYMTNDSESTNQNMKILIATQNKTIIYYSQLEDINRYGIYLKNIKINKLFLIDNLITGANLGIWINVSSGDDADIKLFNNTIDNSHGQAILVNYASYTITKKLYIDGNKIYDHNSLNTYDIPGISLINVQNAEICDNFVIDTQSHNGVGISLDVGCNSNHLKNNNIVGMTGLKILDSGANNRIESNNGYKTESTGTATIPASSTSIAVTHNLASTPTRVTVTPTSSTEGIAYYVPEELKTATTFTITMLSAPTANVSFDWSAVV